MSISHGEPSKPIEQICRTRLPGRTSKSARKRCCRRVMPRWVSVAPFGVPVEPDV
jgi:hypothetical protein